LRQSGVFESPPLGWGERGGAAGAKMGSGRVRLSVGLFFHLPSGKSRSLFRRRLPHLAAPAVPQDTGTHIFDAFGASERGFGQGGEWNWPMIDAERRAGHGLGWERVSRRRRWPKTQLAGEMS